MDGKLIRSGPGDPEIFTVAQFAASRGKLSETGEWKMSSMAWDDERPGLVIPQRYR